MMACRELPADHVFGVPSKHEGHSVSALLKGDYTQEQLDADSDLGKSVKEGWRNIGPADRVRETTAAQVPEFYCGKVLRGTTTCHCSGSENVKLNKSLCDFNLQDNLCMHSISA